MEYINYMEYTNEETQKVFLKDADIVNDMSANTISGNHVLSNGIPSYDLFRKHYNLVSADISCLSDDIEYILSVDKKSMVYHATLLSTNVATNSRLTTFLDDNFHDRNYKFKHGWMYHLSVGQILSDDTGLSNYIGENDYFIVNKTKVLSDITFADIDLIRDALTEVIELCAYLQKQIISNDIDISALSSNLSTKIWIKDPSSDKFKTGKFDDLSVIKISIDEYKRLNVDNELVDNVLYVVSSNYIEAYGQVISNLTMTTDNAESEAATQHYVDKLRYDASLSIDMLCSEISSNDIDILDLQKDLLSIDTRYVETFVDKDKKLYDGHISSDNLIITDPLSHIEGTVHKQYYVTFELGTLVLKPLN